MLASRWTARKSNARYHFGSASRNLFISCLKEIFSLAVRDRIIAVSPAAHLRHAKREKPIRPTPSYEQFKSIIAGVRAQPFNADAIRIVCSKFAMLRKLWLARVAAWGY
jgi:hypothetical protein